MDLFQAVRANIMTYGSLISACENGWLCAMDLLEVMMQQQMKSNVICCLEIARNHAEGSGESLNLQVVRMDVNGCDICFANKDARYNKDGKFVESRCDLFVTFLRCIGDMFV